MRKLYCCLILTLAIGITWAQTPRPGWHATLQVIDETSGPVAGATVAVWYYVHPPRGQSEASEKIEGLTDATGAFTASQTNTGSIGLSFQASKPGFYTITRGHEFSRFKDNDPQKWNVVAT